MAERGPEEKPMPTIWRLPDELWEKVEPILKERGDPPKSTGRASASTSGLCPERDHLPSFRSGCQWNHLPKDFPDDDSSVHRTFQRWVRLGVLDRVWAALVEECEELLGGVDWEWQAAHGAMGKKARFRGISLAPTQPIEAKTG